MATQHNSPVIHKMAMILSRLFLLLLLRRLLLLTAKPTLVLILMASNMSPPRDSRGGGDDDDDAPFIDRLEPLVRMDRRDVPCSSPAAALVGG